MKFSKIYSTPLFILCLIVLSAQAQTKKQATSKETNTKAASKQEPAKQKKTATATNAQKVGHNAAAAVNKKTDAKPVQQPPVKKTNTEEPKAGEVVTDKDGRTTGNSGVITDEIVVERAYRPILADASKIRRSPDMNTTRIFKTDQTYAINNRKLNQDSEIKQLQAQPAPQDHVGGLFNNYAKAGFGNYSTGLAELYINTGADEAMQAGGYFKHLNQEGKIFRQQFSRQEAGIFGKSVLDKVTLNGKVGFESYGTYYYGVEHNSINPIAADPQKQRYRTISLSGEVLKNYQAGSTSDYAAKIDAYTFADKFNARENSLALSGFANKKWQEFYIGINASVDFTKSKDSLNFSNNILRANPYIKLQGDNYKLILGVNLVQEFGTNSKFNFFPSISAEVPIVPEFATLFGGYTGDITKNSLRSFSGENPYLNHKLDMRNSTEKMNIYGGIKGNGGAGLGYKVMAYYKKIDNMALFRNDSLSLQKFNVIYDDAKVTGIEGEINVKISEIFTLGGKVNINNYSMKTQEKAWFMPQVRLAANARASVTKALKLDAEVVMSDKTYGLVAPAGSPAQLAEVKGYVDLSAGAEYTIKQRFGIFARVNNMFGTKYERFLFYPKVGLNAIAGLSYSF